MDLHYQKEITVGALVLAGIGLFVAGTLWLKQASLFKSAGPSVRIEFADIGGLKQDNEVTVSGFSVGRVKKIEFMGPGRVLVMAELNSKPEVMLHTDGSASIVSGIFEAGSKLILDPGTASAPVLPADGVLHGNLDTGIMGRSGALADRADSVMLGVQAVANQKMADDLRATLKSLQRTLNIMSERLPATTDEAAQTMASLRHLTSRLDTILSNPAIDRTVSRFDTLTGNLSGMSAQFTTTGARLDSLLSTILRGEGTLGKLATDSGLYEDTRKTAQSLKGLLDTLQKHPGKVTVQVKIF
jgi:phospholipid/cholesterol/gamma-HCH transport system substrate-binding protein